jgi:hypothetical protein
MVSFENRRWREDSSPCMRKTAAAVFPASARAADEPEDLAQAAAESWLRLTDAGNAGVSWERAAPRE